MCKGWWETLSLGLLEVGRGKVCNASKESLSAVCSLYSLYTYSLYLWTFEFKNLDRLDPILDAFLIQVLKLEAGFAAANVPRMFYLISSVILV